MHKMAAATLRKASASLREELRASEAEEEALRRIRNGFMNENVALTQKVTSMTKVQATTKLEHAASASLREKFRASEAQVDALRRRCNGLVRDNMALTQKATSLTATQALAKLEHARAVDILQLDE